MIDGAAAVAAGNPLAVTPNNHRFDQALVLQRIAQVAGHDGSGLGVMGHESAGRDGKENAQK
jgi:hypothetical protein